MDLPLLPIRGAAGPRRLATLALIVLAGASAALWYARHGKAGEPEQRFLFQEVTRGALVQTVSANGTLNPVTLVNVGTQVSGTVRKLNANFNDHVRQGQVLLELDPSLLTAQVHQSEAAVRNAQAALELALANERRNTALVAQSFLARQTMDSAVAARKAATAQLEQARAQLAKDRVNLGYTVIRSPVAGVIVNRSVDVGQTVAASFQTPTLFQIAEDLSKMQADTSFAEADIGQIRPGQAARFSVDAYPNRSFDGTVKLIRLNPTVQQNVVTYDVVIAVANPDGVLLPGMTAYVSIVVARRQHALLVPNAALRYHLPEGAAPAPAATGRPGRNPGAPSGTVYVLRGRAVVPVTVATGITDGRHTEVLSGDLQAGQQVVVGDTQPSSDQSTSTVRLRMF
jgi:HlyD family secretion protein